MNQEHHQERHASLHKALDELLADYITQHPKQSSFLSMPVINLIAWSAEQTEKPDHQEPGA